ncbi:bis-aminopropyl spermidine synthase family protein [Dactylosporangium darangshiense]|uniref:bis-aminopropyl spermidine synthase family protein n=1 Tax=Dactylosporangium darangshiense TaxID=579108 RepID=UPI003639753F
MDLEPIDAVAAVVSGYGIAGRRLREIIARLTESPTTLDDLVRDLAVPRRTVEALLRAAGPDLDTGGETLVLQDSVRQRYGERFALATLHDVPEVPGMAELVAGAPAADRALDHVSATADTARRRAQWLAGTYDLAGARLVCIGDHDLTSLAVRRACPDVEITVVDVDERLLAYIDGQGAGIACYHADLRFGLPPVVAGSGDLVFTDPPYTPEGVQLFLGRGAQALRDRGNGRLVMAYGFSPLTPALGLKVQRAVLDLDLVIEAMLPAFNRYHGAQAVGSASDLYVCRPTPQTWQVLDRRLDRLAGSANISHTASSPWRARRRAARPASSAAARCRPTSSPSTSPPTPGRGWPGCCSRSTSPRSRCWCRTTTPTCATRPPRPRCGRSSARSTTCACAAAPPRPTGRPSRRRFGPRSRRTRPAGC